MGSQVLLEHVFPCGLLCMGLQFRPGACSSLGFSRVPNFPQGLPTCLGVGSSMSCRCRYVLHWISVDCSMTMCLTMIFTTTAGESLHWPWSTSYPFFTDLPVYRIAFLTFSYSSVLPAVVVPDFLPPSLAQHLPVLSQSCQVLS